MSDEAIKAEVTALLTARRMYVLSEQHVNDIVTRIAELVTLPPAQRPPIRGWVGALSKNLWSFLLECGFTHMAGPPTAMRWADDLPDGTARFAEIAEWAAANGIVHIPQRTAGPEDGDRIIPGRMVDRTTEGCRADTGLPCPYHPLWASMMYDVVYVRTDRFAPWRFRDWEPYKREGAEESDVRFRPHLLNPGGRYGCDYRSNEYIRAAIQQSDVEAEVLFQAAPNAARTAAEGEEGRFRGHLQRMVVDTLLQENRRAIVADTRGYWAHGSRLTAIRGEVLEQGWALRAKHPGAEYTVVANMTEAHWSIPWEGAGAGERRDRALAAGKWLWQKGVGLFDGAWVYALGAGESFTDEQLDAIKQVATCV